MERHRFVDVDCGEQWVFSQKTFESGGPNPTLRWGPLSASLEELFNQKFSLFAYGPAVKMSSQRQFRVYLVSPDSQVRQLWRVGSARFHALLDAPLQAFVGSRTAQHGSLMKFPEWFDDPVAAVKSLYGHKVRKKPIMMGNQTLSQFVANLPT